MMEFFRCFQSVSVSVDNLTGFNTLDNGVVMYEALSEIAPNYFDLNELTRETGSSWALKIANFRTIVRNLCAFYTDELDKKSHLFDDLERSFDDADNVDENTIISIAKLIIYASIYCDGCEQLKQEVQGISRGSAEHISQIINDLDKMDIESDDDDEDSSDGGNDLEFDRDILDDVDTKDIFQVYTELEELKQVLKEKDQEIENKNNEISRQNDTHEHMRSKLEGLNEESRNQLSKLEHKHLDLESLLRKKSRELEDVKRKNEDTEKDRIKLEDDLDVEKSKVVEFKKRLELFERMVKTQNEKSDHAEARNQKELTKQIDLQGMKIEELKKENSKISKLEIERDSLKIELKKIMSIKNEWEEIAENKTTEFSKLKSDLDAAKKAKNMYQGELEELKTNAPVGASYDSFRLAQLEKENQNLKEEIEKQKTSVAKAAAAGDIQAMQTQMSHLNAELAKKDLEKRKVLSDKEKLEAYTKKTLSKFQEKYLVALQECKAKLAAKHEKIVSMEMRNETEKSAQKREERLLSSTVYELGLTIMQQRLSQQSG
eukprot:CAMPEP_0184855584 /NCGR_PEP_ID=MMETSP0580-20130426/783_1 /TAXON_ID=1118495 /ORGANISM="Dactyliosolen fragilissimus" /LENGTH=545 /DNA_ID=CAMNT_0027350133 /DNA_START=42 /DNA_END=1679 /DNA_ORIENTATION=+